jgi:hypothetical protein
VAAIPALLAEASARELPPASVLVGLLQPALYKAGCEWAEGRMSIDEAGARFVNWCHAFFEQLPRASSSPPAGIDLLLFLAPGNAHTLGARFAAELLGARGITTHFDEDARTVDAMKRAIEAARPRVVGISCALPASLVAADRAVLELRAIVDPTWPRRFLIGGFALRGEGFDWVSAAGASLAVTLEDVERIVRE